MSQAEIFALAEKCGAMRTPFTKDNDSIFAMTGPELSAFAAALAAQPSPAAADDAFLELQLGLDLIKWNRAKPADQRLVKVAYENAVAIEVLRAYRAIEAAHGINAAPAPAATTEQGD